MVDLSSVQVLQHRAKNYCFVEGNFLFDEWLDTGSFEDLSGLTQAQEALVRRSRGKKFAQLTLVKFDRVPVLDEATRALVSKARAFMEPALCASALVLVSSGFVAATMRSLIAGVVLLQRKELPNKVFGDLDDGLLWLAPHVTLADGRKPRPHELRALIDAQREKLLNPR